MILDAARTLLQATADPARAPAMQAYMKTDEPFHGVAAPARRRILRQLVAAHPVVDADAWRAQILELWSGTHREERYLAVDLAVRGAKRFMGPRELPLAERLVREGAWWDLVDPVACHLVGRSIEVDAPGTWAVVDRWIDDPDLWIRRSAILCQNGLLRRGRGDEARLFAFCTARAHEREFFVRKAIGWALRDYAHSHPDRVRWFLAEHGDQLSGLSRREASKHL